MLRPIVMSAEAGKLNRRKARWSMRKQEIYTWLLNKLNLDIHGFERDGQLEGSCILTSTVREPGTHRDSRITASICTFEDRISVVVMSICFADGDGWRPRGGPRKSEPDDLDIISGSVLRGSGRYWQLDQQYGDDIGAPGPVNRDFGGDETAGAEAPDDEPVAATASAKSDNDCCDLAAGDDSRLIARITTAGTRAIGILDCLSFIRERVVSRRDLSMKNEEMKIALMRVDAVLNEIGERDTSVRRSFARQKYRCASGVLNLNRESRKSYFQHMLGQSFGSGRSWEELDRSSVARLLALIGAVDVVAVEASIAGEIGSELVELREVVRRLKLAVDHLHPKVRPSQARTHDVNDMYGLDVELAVPLSIGSAVSDGAESSRGIDSF